MSSFEEDAMSLYTDKELDTLASQIKEEHSRKLSKGYLALAEDSEKALARVAREINRRKIKPLEDSDNYDEWGNYIGPEIVPPLTWRNREWWTRW